ncbi:GTP 3',8-cyclase MoaA [Halobacterium salinarum]|uniref:Probable GTP 3',8-cyclase n=4 Tax=Halobacterium salinarum TaxID=2242 RepID=MOAA_HALSA|nr:GTP 3',8-cyclase MoaA [Halobacterium salinarum]B0R2L5.1 RecName: Full=Probable GTP 3',8-cyclase; AltName: Full=Molybdenum cofactor biosynthesis protein A [Halobacterium salinarum R1]Q9HST4.2 RecName: Full=Probable GTP 3',8-cyclase; AltName: Full=Molybdenum cofactor biosynthesis protein A [Halobacterium salinarum NRC-1]MBB6090927.1 cyclic pyranopterin phosphate synthase [Halobacterium salinarum]MDL0134988.1 GTP 3',8-cyclase MoaA [Halobacterium salinarum]MDL0137745.1 GTP 3',8-cyclase MoaA [Ha
MLEDDFGRDVSGVRVSLTDRCNFDCVYCHNEGLGDTRGPIDPRENELSTDRVVRFLSVAHEFGVDAVKLTGGEPMLRSDLEAIIRRTPDDMAVSMTTNGTFLPGRAADLVDAGLERVNISQDAMDNDAFAELTQSGAYDAVLEGVEAALDAGLAPVKLNMVVFEPTAGYVPEMVDHVAARDGLRLQLIEYMPELAGHPEWAIDIDRVHDWLADRADRIETREMHDRRRYWVSSRDAGSTADDAAQSVTPDGGAHPDQGMVEIVDPVGNPQFCANCHRVRLTHDGYLKGCLNRNDDLRGIGETTQSMRAAFRETVANRVPYYGEYMTRTDDGGWEINDDYLDVEGDRDPYEYAADDSA